MENVDIQALVESYFHENEMNDCFFVGIKINGKKIEVFIDKDGGISFEICHRVSRIIESVLDEKLPFGDDYILEVSSPGVGTPLKLPRQYKNNIGRTIEVTTKDDNFKGTLVTADDDKITVTYEEKIKEGKKNVKVEIEKSVMYTDIIEGKIKIVF